MRLGSRSDRLCVWLLRDELDEISTRVVEDGNDGCSDVHGWLREHHALGGESGVFGLDVVDGELRERDAVFDERISIRLDRRVACRLQQQLWTVRRLRRDDSEPGVTADGYVSVLREAEYVGVEGKGRAGRPRTRWPG